MATGLMSSKLAVTLSPGMTISMPSGSVTVPAAQNECLSSDSARKRENGRMQECCAGTEASFLHGRAVTVSVQGQKLHCWRKFLEL